MGLYGEMIQEMIKDPGYTKEYEDGAR